MKEVSALSFFMIQIGEKFVISMLDYVLLRLK